MAGNTDHGRAINQRSVKIIALVLVLALIGAYFSFLYVDQPAADAEMAWTEGPVMEWAIRIAIWAGNWQLGPLIIAIVLIAGHRHWRPLLKSLAFAYLLRTAVVEWMKTATGRPRPYQLADASVFHGFGGGAAFPSGHASFSFMFAVIVGEWFPRWRPLTYGFAVFVSLSRILNHAHFVSDVIVGAVIGVVTGLIALHFWPPVRERNREEPAGRKRQRSRPPGRQKDALTNRAEAGRRYALITLYIVLTVAAAVLAIFYLDPLRAPVQSDAVQSRPIQALGHLGRLLGTWDVAPAIFAVALIAAGWRWRFMLRSLVVGYAVQTSVTEGLKWLIGRPRPRDMDDPWLFFGPGAGHQSMPSSHASFAFMFAVVLAGYFPRLKWPLYGFGVFIALTRVVLNAHYVSDVIVGGLIGVLAGMLVLAIWPPPDARGRRSEDSGRPDGTDQRSQRSSHVKGEQRTATTPEITVSSSTGSEFGVRHEPAPWRSLTLRPVNGGHVGVMKAGRVEGEATRPEVPLAGHKPV